MPPCLRFALGATPDPFPSHTFQANLAVLLFVAALVLVAFAVSLAAACAALTARYPAVEGVSLRGILSNEDREATIRVAHTDVKRYLAYLGRR